MPDKSTLRVAVFRAANNWPLYAAASNGFLEREGLRVDLVHISSSKDQLKGLVNNEYGIVHTAADNVLAACSGASPWIGDRGEPRPGIFMGGDDGFLSVYSSQAVRSLSDVRGRNVGFDSTTTGFAFVLKKILSTAGLKHHDYNEVVVGGTDLRYKALIRASIDVSIMTPPHDLLCLEAGLKKLADVYQFFARYQGVVGATCIGFFTAPFLRVYRTCFTKGLAWLRDTKNKEEAIHILREYLQLECGNELLSNLYDSMVLRTRGNAGFTRDAAINRHGLAQVANLRREFSPSSTLRDPSEYVIAL